jgi:hypothetical protein
MHIGGNTIYDKTALVANAAGSILTSVAINDTVDEYSSNSFGMFFFGVPYDFAANETFYLLLRADTANNTSVYYDEWRSSSSLSGLWGANCCRVTATTLGTYTEDTDALAVVYPILSGFSDAAGAGGLAALPVGGFVR